MYADADADGCLKNNLSSVGKIKTKTHYKMQITKLFLVLYTKKVLHVFGQMQRFEYVVALKRY